MHISFVVDPLVPQGFRKIVKQVVLSLRVFIPDLSYSTETKDWILHDESNGVMHSSKLFARKHRVSTSHLIVYLISGKLVSRSKSFVHGVSKGDVSIISFANVSHNPYEEWTALFWELMLHEIGHSLGLVPKRRHNITVNSLGTVHCKNECVMRDDVLFVNFWQHKAKFLKNRNTPFCDLCAKYLRNRFHT